MKRQLGFLIALIFIFGMVVGMTSFASALEFNNYKTYDEDKKTVTIKESLLGERIANVTLLTPQQNVVPVGKDVQVAELEIINLNDAEYKDIFQDWTFEDNKDKDKKVTKKIDIKLKLTYVYDSPLYNITCEEGATDSFTQCNSTLWGYEKKYRHGWEELTPADIKKGQKMTIGLFTETKHGESIEWVPQMWGLDLTEFATWNSSVESGGYYYLSLNESGDGGSPEYIDYYGNFSGFSVFGATGGFAGVNNSTTNTSFYFDGINDYITTNGTGCDVATINSFALWFKTSTNSAGALMGGRDAGSGDTRTIWLFDERVDYQRWDSSGGSPQYNTVYADGDWHFVATVENSSGAFLYYDGAFVASNSAVLAMNDLSSTPCYIGDYNDGSPSDSVDAYIDEWATWDRELTVDELDILFNSGQGNSPWNIGAGASPEINLTSPTNSTYTTTSIDVNWTNTTAYNAARKSLNGAANSTLSKNDSITAIQGQNNISVYYNDSSTGVWVSDTEYFFVDSIIPLVQFVSPTEDNNTRVLRNYIEINTTATDTNLDTITTNIYWANDTLLQTNSSASSPLFVNLTGLPLGTYKYNSTANDTAGNENSTETNYIVLTAWTSYFGIDVPINDFTFSSATYVTADTFQFNTSSANTFFGGLNSMEIDKLTGGLSNDVYMRVLVDGVTIVDELLRTIAGVAQPGVSGSEPFLFNVSNGEHNMTIQFRRTGNGNVIISNVDFSLGEFETTAGNTGRGNLTNVSYTYNSVTPILVHNQTINKEVNTSTFLSSKFNINASGLTNVTCKFIDGGESPYFGVQVPDAATTRSVSTNYITTPEALQENVSISCFSSNAVDVTITGRVLEADMRDNSSNPINNNGTTLASTNFTNTIALSSGVNSIINMTGTMRNGTNILASAALSLGSTTGEQTITTQLNLTNASGVVCSTEKDRYLSSNSDIANIFFFKVCEGLKVGESYDFEVYTILPAGETGTLYDEAISGFENTLFDTATINTPPVISISNPNEGDTLSSTQIINWTISDSQSDTTLTNITVNNATNTTQIATNLAEDILSTSWNTIGYKDGSWNITARTCENNTADLFCSNNTISVTVNNNQLIISLVSPPDQSSSGQFAVPFVGNASFGTTLKNVTLYTNQTSWGAKNSTSLLYFDENAFNNDTSQYTTTSTSFVLLKTYSGLGNFNLSRIFFAANNQIAGQTAEFYFSLHYINGTALNSTPVSVGNTIEILNQTNLAEDELIDQIDVFGRVSSGAGTAAFINNTIFAWENTTSTEFTFYRDITEATLWNYYVCAIDDTCNFSSSNFTVVPDLIVPFINVTYPNETFDYGEVGNTTRLDWNYSDINPSTDCSYDYGGTNNSVDCTLNTTSVTIQDVNQTIRFWAKDSSNNFAYNDTSWSYKVLVINETFDSVVSAASTAFFNLTSRLGSGLTLSNASLWYNGTKHVTTSSSIGGFYWIDGSIIVPNLDSNQNVSFFWELELSDASSVNTSERIQQIIATGIDDCSVFTNQIYNFTLVDEESQAALTGNTTIEVYLGLYDPTRTIILFNFTNKYEGVNPARVCLENAVGNSTYSVDGVIKYYADNYSIEYYNLANSTLDNNSQNIILYDLKLEDSTEFKITFRDSDFIVVEGALISVNRQYIPEGTFKTVELPITDSNGQTVAHLVEKDIVYNFIVQKNGEILGSFNNLIAFCDDVTIGSCFITLNALQSSQQSFDYDENLGINYNFDYNQTSRVLSFTYISTDGTSKLVLLNSTKADQIGNVSVCSESISSASATLTCTIPAFIGNGSIFTEIYVDGAFKVLHPTKAGREVYLGNGGYFILFFLLISLVMMFSSTKSGVIVAVLLAFVSGTLLFLIEGAIIGSLSSITWLVIAGLILLWKLNKENQT